MDPESITCPICKATSYHPVDIQVGYCGNCHAYTSEPGGIGTDPYDFYCVNCGVLGPRFPERRAVHLMLTNDIERIDLGLVFLDRHKGCTVELRASPA